MKIVALVSPMSRARVASAVAVDHSLSLVDDLASLRCELDEGRAEVGMIDLDACSERDSPLLTTIVSRHRSAIIAYAAFAQPAVRQIVSLARHGLCHVIYRGLDDGRASVRRAIRDAAGSTMSGQIVAHLSTPLASCSTQFREAIGDLFDDPLRFKSATDVAQAAGITRRSLDRTLCTLDLEPARTFLLAARVTWAYPRMRSARIRVCDISRQLGVAKPERFAQHTRFLLGMSPSIVRTQVSPDQFIEMIVARLRRQPRAAPSAVCEYGVGNSAFPAPSRSAEPPLLREGMATV